MSLAITDFLKGRGAPLCVNQEQPLSFALDLMRANDFTQLPVVDSADRFVGLVTSDSILRAIEALQIPVTKMRVIDAVASSRALDPDGDTSDLLGALRDGYAAVVVDLQRKVTGIITAFDASQHLRDRSEDIMLVEDIESSLKDHISAAYQDSNGDIDEPKLSAAILQVADPNRSIRGRVSQGVKLLARRITPPVSEEVLQAVVQEACPPGKTPDFEELTLVSYVDLIVHQSVWSDYGAVFGIDAPALKGLLDKVRVIRNSLAHFRRDLSATDREQLRFCADWLERRPPRHRQIVASGHRSDEPQASDVNGPISVEDEIEPGEGRYAKLALWLKSVGHLQDSVEKTFGDIERILGGPLPPAASEHRSWWANDSVSHPQSRLWLEVGWRIYSVNLSKRSVVFARIVEREKDYIRFFSDLANRLQHQQSFVLKTNSPTGVSWHIFGRSPDAGPAIGWFVASFARGGKIRAELYIDAKDRHQNKRVFDSLLSKRLEIEENFGEPLSWERLENRRSSRIALYRDGVIIGRNLPELVDWFANTLASLHRVLTPHVESLQVESSD